MPPPTSTPRPRSLAVVTDRLFFEHLLDHGPDSRANAAAATDLSRPTASEAARRLGEDGLVRAVAPPAGAAAPRRGRPADYYDVDPTYGHTLALAASSGRAVARTEDLRGQTLCQADRHLPERMTGADLTATLSQLATDVVREADTPCLAATAAQGNPVAPVTQRPVALPQAPFPEGLGDLLGVLRSVCPGPVRLDNDVNWAMLAEHRTGAARGLDDAVLLYLGPGVGAGILLSGAVQRGHHGTAGELGYLRTRDRMLMSLLLEHGGAPPGGERLDVQRIVRTFDQDPDGPNATRFVKVLAETVSNFATFLDPQVLVLAGPLTRGEPLVARLTAALRPLAPGLGPEVRAGELGADAPLLGAALAARELALEAIWEGYRR